MKRLALAAAGLVITGAAQAAELPEQFLGAWTRDEPDNAEITGIDIGPRSYHEPGYNCDIRSVQEKTDLTSNTPIFIVEMRCAGEGEHDRVEAVREVWAMRRVGNQDVLAIAATGGASFPSIHLLRRAEEIQ